MNKPLKRLVCFERRSFDQGNASRSPDCQEELKKVRAIVATPYYKGTYYFILLRSSGKHIKFTVPANRGTPAAMLIFEREKTESREHEMEANI